MDQALLNGSVGTAEPNPSSVRVQPLADRLRVEAGTVHAAVVELFSADGRLLARASFGGERTLDLPWPEERSLLLARVTGSSGGVLAVRRVLRPF